MSWVYVSIQQYGNVPWYGAVVVVILFVALLGLLTGVLSVLVRASAMRIRPENPVSQRVVGCAMFALVWVFYEYVRTYLFTGLPILDAGYVLLDTPIEGIAPIFGVKAMSFVVAFVAASLISGWQNFAAAFVICTTCGLLGLIEFTKRLDSYAVGIAQANIPLTEKFEMARSGESFRIYSRLTHDLEPKNLVVWSEAVFALDQPQMVESLELARKTSKHDGIATGYIEYVDQVRFNSLLVSGAESSNYRKIRLVPLGEYVPFRSLFNFFSGVDVPHSDLSESDTAARTLQLGNLRIAPAICYEASFEGDVRSAVEESNADVILVVSEDAWFGDSLAPHQNFQMARMRALEHGRYLVRAANSGISGIVGPDGDVVVQAPQFKRTVIQGEIHTMVGSTPFSHGDFFFIVTMLGILVGTSSRIRRALH